MVDNELLDFLRKTSARISEQAIAGDILSQRLMQQYNLFFQPDKCIDRGQLLVELAYEWQQREVMRGNPGSISL